MACTTPTVTRSLRTRCSEDIVAGIAVEITLFGPPQVRRDGRPASFDTRKAIALLADLALAVRPRSREQLCDLLWPDQDAEKARGALRRTLSTLRKGLGEGWLETTGDSIELMRGSGLDLDIDRFRALSHDTASIAELKEAVATFRGELLEGFTIRGSAAFEHWHRSEADALRRDLLSALERLVEALVEKGEMAGAVAYAERRLELDPTSEPAHRDLIRLYAWSGDRGRALEQCRACVRALSQELGVPPVAETRALFEQVGAGSMPPPPGAVKGNVGARERIGDLSTLVGDYAHALSSYETAASTAPERGAELERKIGNVHHRRGEWERAEARYRAALETAPADAGGLRARIEADLGLTLLAAGSVAAAAQRCASAAQLAEAAGDPRALAQATNVLGVVAWRQGHLDEAAENLERSLALARELGEVPAEIAALNNLALVRRETADLEQARELTERALALCRSQGDRHREAALENNLADVHNAAGREDEAMAHLKRAVSIFSEVGADEGTRLPEIWKLVSW